MTDEELDEINEKVALKLGMHTAVSPSKIISGWCHSHPDDFPHFPVNKLPDFSRDIKAAWEIVERLNKVGHFVRILTGGAGTHLAQVGVQHEAFGPVGLSHAKESIAETAPLTICLAFLKLP